MFTNKYRILTSAEQTDKGFEGLNKLFNNYGEIVEVKPFITPDLNLLVEYDVEADVERFSTMINDIREIGANITKIGLYWVL